MTSYLTTGMAQLKSTFPGHVHFENDPNYSSNNRSYWTPAVILKPSCIFTPTQPSQVSQAFKIISAAQIPFAVRGGGRNTNVGWSNINNGVLISSSELKGLEFGEREGKRVLKVAVGMTQIEIFRLLKGTGLVISTGKTSFLYHTC